MSVETKAYTQSQVWSLLTGEPSEDVDEYIDINDGLKKLSPAERTFLILLNQGYTATQAMEGAGLTGRNSTRLKRAVVRKLTRIMNGDE